MSNSELMIVAEAIVHSKPVIDLYLVNQVIDILLWGWICLIMTKRVVCRGFDLRISTILESIKRHSFMSITRHKLKDLVKNHHYYSDLLLFLASLVAICQFSNQFYSHASGISYGVNLLARTIPWMIFHKLLTISILVKYKKSQPKLFINIIEEFKRINWRVT